MRGREEGIIHLLVFFGFFLGGGEGGLGDGRLVVFSPFFLKIKFFFLVSGKAAGEPGGEEESMVRGRGGMGFWT